MTTPNPMLAELDAVVRLGNEAYVEGKAYAYQDATVRALNFMLDYHATLSDMAKRLEAAERDAARYQWLRGLDSQFMLKKYGCGDLPVDEDLDAEIDAAIDATQEGEG